MAVIEFIDGPKDTLRLLEKYKDELAEFKEKNSDLINMPLDTMMQNIRTSARGRMDHYWGLKKENEKFVDRVKVMAGREKSKYIMEQFAKKAVGLPLETKQPEFWVK